MSVKDKTLEELENHRGEYISGEEIARNLQVSRNAVWKAMKSLEKEGYSIDAVKNKGYRLAESNDILSEQSIQRYLTRYHDVFRIDVRKSVTSTNDLLKLKAFEGAKEGQVLIAEEQIEGKGQLGRSFYSPKESGIYMSLLLRPKEQIENALCITTSAAVAVAQAIEYVSDRKVEIKWVNDIYCDGRKVSGILTEALFNIETNGFDYVVLGIGINVKEPELGFPKKLDGIVDSVFEHLETDIRSQLAAEVLMRFWQYYENLSKKEFLNDYKERSLLIGKKIMVEQKNGEQRAKAVSITDQFHLIVELEDGTIKELSAGSVRLLRDNE